MKKLFWITVASILALVSVVQAPVQAADRKVLFFKEASCTECAEVEGFMTGVGTGYDEEEDYILKMENAGIEVIVYDIQLNPDLQEYAYENSDGEMVTPSTRDVFFAYSDEYGHSLYGVPVIFVGDQYFYGANTIKDAVDNNTVFDLSDDGLLEVSVYDGQATDRITGFIGFLLVLVGGLIDGFNPCAIALLLLFISFLGFSDNKRILTYVSITYIFAIYISYYAMGSILYTFIDTNRDTFELFGTIFAWVIMLLTFFLFILNFYDFWQSRQEQYGKFKSQLPKWIQKMNKRILKVFTEAMNDDSDRGLFRLLSLTFVLGLILSLTEILCTGGIYFAVIGAMSELDTAIPYILLIFYNIMFVLPLIIIALVAIKMKSVNTVSNWVREHMTVIKFANAMLFFVIFLYFLFRIF
jgi:cytochrome c biogenesis protein CcdA